MGRIKRLLGKRKLMLRLIVSLALVLQTAITPALFLGWALLIVPIDIANGDGWLALRAPGAYLASMRKTWREAWSTGPGAW